MHHPIVLKEVGRPIYGEESITPGFKTARDAVKGQHTAISSAHNALKQQQQQQQQQYPLALQFISTNQYVHRDVSLGNILVVDGKGQLVDLELLALGVARALEPYVSMHGVSQPLTYRIPTLIITSKLPSRQWRSHWEAITLLHNSQAAVDRLLGKRQPALFVHNPLHGVESLWLGTSLGSVMRYTLDDLG